MLRSRLWRGMVLVLVSVLAGCGGVEGTPAPNPAPSATPSGAPDLNGTEWTLVKLNGASLLPGTNITLSFEEGRAGGFAGCNAYGVSHEFGGDGRLSISLLERTLQACLEPEGVLAQEDAYLAALQEAATYRVAGDQLEIEDGTGNVTLLYAQKARALMDPSDLQGTAWQLVSLDGASPVEGSSITLVFDGAGQASGLAGCREYTATYEAEGDRIHFLSNSMSGDESCLADEALYWQEGAYTDALTWTTNYRLGEGQLEIETARGEVLAFELMDDEPALSPEPAGDECSGYLDLLVSSSSGEMPAVVTSYQCGGVHVDSTGQSPGPASFSMTADASLRLHFGVDVPPDSVAARVYAGPGVSAAFFRWPEELPGGTEPVAVLDDVAGQSLEFQSPLATGEYSAVIRAVWHSEIEVFYAFSFRIG
jgi:heat shock protein HslJ